MTQPTDEAAVEQIVQALRKQAQDRSEASRMMAEAKSLRQESNTERRTDLYSFSKPDQTLEWRAADLLKAERQRAEQAEQKLAEAEEREVSVTERLIKAYEKEEADKAILAIAREVVSERSFNSRFPGMVITNAAPFMRLYNAIRSAASGEHGECICPKCGIRHGGGSEDGGF